MKLELHEELQLGMRVKEHIILVRFDLNLQCMSANVDV